MRRHNIPTAEYHVFNDYDSATAFVTSCTERQVVIKPSGLTAVRGIFLTEDSEGSLEALKRIMLRQEFGGQTVCDTVIVEDRLSGPEFSIMAVTDGHSIRYFSPFQAYKRLLERDQGPNTGGMGCHAPSQLCSDELLSKIKVDVFRAAIDGMRREGRYNLGCRECQIYLMKADSLRASSVLISS